MEIFYGVNDKTWKVPVSCSHITLLDGCTLLLPNWNSSGIRTIRTTPTLRAVNQSPRTETHIPNPLLPLDLHYSMRNVHPLRPHGFRGHRELPARPGCRGRRHDARGAGRDVPRPQWHPNRSSGLEHVKTSQFPPSPLLTYRNVYLSFLLSPSLPIFPPIHIQLALSSEAAPLRLALPILFTQFAPLIPYNLQSGNFLVTCRLTCPRHHCHRTLLYPCQRFLTSSSITVQQDTVRNSPATKHAVILAKNPAQHPDTPAHSCSAHLSPDGSQPDATQDKHPNLRRSPASQPPMDNQPSGRWRPSHLSGSRRLNSRLRCTRSGAILTDTPSPVPGSQLIPSHQARRLRRSRVRHETKREQATPDIRTGRTRPCAPARIHELPKSRPRTSNSPQPLGELFSECCVLIRLYGARNCCRMSRPKFTLISLVICLDPAYSSSSPRRTILPPHITRGPPSPCRSISRRS